MYRRIYLLLTMTLVLLLIPFVATAQQREAREYTFVGLWSIPQDKWDAFTAYWDENYRPILERMSADGTIMGWGRAENAVQRENGFTHVTWWEATSVAGIERVRVQILKLPLNPATAGARHREYLFLPLMRRTHATRATSGYLWINSYEVQPRKGEEWRERWWQDSKPIYDELLANGTISYWAVGFEIVHTENTNVRYVVYIAPTVDAIDKVHEAMLVRQQKRTPEETRAIRALPEVTVSGTHRDFFARVPIYTHK